VTGGVYFHDTGSLVFTANLSLEYDLIEQNAMLKYEMDIT